MTLLGIYHCEMECCAFDDPPDWFWAWPLRDDGAGPCCRRCGAGGWLVTTVKVG